MALLASVTYKLLASAGSALIQVAARAGEEILHRFLEIGIDCNYDGVFFGDRVTIGKTLDHTFVINFQNDMTRAANRWCVADLQPPQWGRCG